MNTTARKHYPALALGLSVLLSESIPNAAPAKDSNANSTTVIGGGNALLANGAEALQKGRIEDGLRLTLEGLKIPGTAKDTAAGHSNACAGLALLKQWDEALVHCNRALELDTANWRSYNNRAAIYIAKGLYDLAIHDLETGLSIAPRSAILKESMRIAQKDKRILTNPNRKSVLS